MRPVEMGASRPAWTLEQVIGLCIGGALVLAGAVLLFLVASADPFDQGSYNSKLAVAILLLAGGAVPIGFSMFSRWRAVRALRDWYLRQEHAAQDRAQDSWMRDNGLA